MHVDVDVQSPAFKSYPTTRHVEEARKGGKKRKYEIYHVIYRKPTVPPLLSEVKNELKDTNEISVQLCSENTRKTEVEIYILTGKIYLYNKIFSLNQNGNSLAKQELLISQINAS